MGAFVVRVGVDEFLVVLPLLRRPAIDACLGAADPQLLTRGRPICQLGGPFYALEESVRRVLGERKVQMGHREIGIFLHGFLEVRQCLLEANLLRQVATLEEEIQRFRG